MSENKLAEVEPEATLISWSPARKSEEVGTVLRTSSKQIESYLQKARQVADQWREKSVAERALLLTPLATQLTARREELATLQAAEVGKPIKESYQEILGAYIYSRDVERATRLAKSINTGMVAINSAYYLLPSNPFGGSKATGGGRAHGPFAFHEICNQKVVARPV